jgi:hypothetical protein
MLLREFNFGTWILNLVPRPTGRSNKLKVLERKVLRRIFGLEEL